MRSFFILLFLAQIAFAAPDFPPPIWRNPWSTNQPPRPVTGLNNLSVTNLGSGTAWLFYAVSPNTVARLIDLTNVVGGLIRTNPNQFLGVPLSIKSGALVTNLTDYGTFTNISGSSFALYQIQSGAAVDSKVWQHTVAASSLTDAVVSDNGLTVLVYDTITRSGVSYVFRTFDYASNIFSGAIYGTGLWTNNGTIGTSGQIFGGGGVIVPSGSPLKAGDAAIGVAIIAAADGTINSAGYGTAYQFPRMNAAATAIEWTSNVTTNGTGGGGLTTNANQFLGVPLSIKKAAQVTNLTDWGSATNILGAPFALYQIESGAGGDSKIWQHAISATAFTDSLVSDDGLTVLPYDTITRSGVAYAFRNYDYASNLFSGPVYLTAPVGSKTNLAVDAAGKIVQVDATGGNLTTNANQFLGAPLSIKAAPQLTNTTTTGDYTNINAGTLLGYQINSSGGTDSKVWRHAVTGTTMTESIEADDASGFTTFDTITRTGFASAWRSYGYTSNKFTQAVYLTAPTGARTNLAVDSVGKIVQVAELNIDGKVDELNGVATNLTVYTGSPGLTVVPKTGTTSNSFQILTTNLVPQIFVMSNGVFSISNSPVLMSWLLSNGVPFGAVTGANFVTGITGYVANGVANLGVSVSGGGGGSSGDPGSVQLSDGSGGFTSVTGFKWDAPILTVPGDLIADTATVTGVLTVGGTTLEDDGSGNLKLNENVLIVGNIELFDPDLASFHQAMGQQTGGRLNIGTEWASVALWPAICNTESLIADSSGVYPGTGNAASLGLVTNPWGQFYSDNATILKGALIVGPSGGAVTNILTASATLDFPSTLAQTDSDLPITVTGAAVGDVVQIGTPVPLTGSCYTGFASNNTVYVRFSVYGLTAKDPASAVFRVVCTKF